MTDEVDVTPMGPDDDSALLDELRAMFRRIDPVPPGLLAVAEASFVMRTLDAELAALTYDSATDTGRLALVRGAPTTRMLTFEAPGITVEVEAAVVDAGRRRLVGQLVPPRPGAVEVSHRGGVVSITPDELGGFVAPDIEAGPVRVRCGLGVPAAVVDTDWFVA